MTRYVSIGNECAHLSLAAQPDGIALEYKLVGLSRHLIRQQSEFALAMAIKAIRLASGREIQPVRVRFAHVRTSDLKDFIRSFGCPVEFKTPSDHLTFSRETLALPQITADPQLLHILRPICEAETGALNQGGSLRASVQSEIQRLLPQGHAIFEIVAKTLGLSVRTLSRNLAAEGSAFTEIMDEMRHASSSSRSNLRCWTKIGRGVDDPGERAHQVVAVKRALATQAQRGEYQADALRPSTAHRSEAASTSRR